MLLLDHKLKGKDRILVHPLTNTSTVALSSEGLEAFLRSAYLPLHQTNADFPILAKMKLDELFIFTFCAGVMLFDADQIIAMCL